MFKAVALSALLLLGTLSAQELDNADAHDVAEVDNEGPMRELLGIDFDVDFGDDADDAMLDGDGAARELLGKKKHGYRPECYKDRQCRDGDRCTYDYCKYGKCKTRPIKCRPKKCYDVSCDKYKGCVKTPKHCPETDEHDVCKINGYCDKKTGECAYEDKVCKPKKCHDVECDPYKGCVYTPKDCPETDPHDVCKIDGFCDRHTGECAYKDKICKPKPCYDVKCDPYKGCVYTKKTCDKPGKCETGPGYCKAYGTREVCKYKKLRCPHRKCYYGKCSKYSGKCKYYRKFWIPYCRPRHHGYGRRGKGKGGDDD